MHFRGSKTVDMKLLFLHTSTLIQIMFLKFKIPLSLTGKL